MSKDLLQLAAGPLASDHTSAPKRQRGVLRQQALVEAGLRLTTTRRWSEVTVADIAEAIGCSVGTFYTRFHNKDAYFTVLQQLLAEVLLQRLQAFHAAPQRQRESASAFIAAWTHLIVRSYCLHGGLYAAALARTQQLPPDAVLQMPLARVRLATRAALVQAMGQRPGWSGPDAAARLGFAHQMLNGLLANAVLINAGPLQLDDPALVEQAAQALCAYLGLPRPRQRPGATGDTA